MAGRGPAPKESRSRVRDERRREESLKVIEPTGKTYGFDLPESHVWPDATVTWWETWRRSPQAQAFTDTDWSFLLDTAVLHAEFWLGDLKAAAELRLRAAKFGATPEDRARLKIQIGTPNPTPTRRPQAGKTDRRSRLLQAVEDVEA